MRKQLGSFLSSGFEDRLLTTRCGLEIVTSEFPFIRGEFPQPPPKAVVPGLGVGGHLRGTARVAGAPTACSPYASCLTAPLAR